MIWIFKTFGVKCADFSKNRFIYKKYELVYFKHRIFTTYYLLIF